MLPFFHTAYTNAVHIILWVVGGNLPPSVKSRALDIRCSSLQKLDFKFPLTVSCVHFICSSIGAYIAIHVLKAKPLIEVEPEDRWKRIFPMSFVFCINIVLGNVSLRYIPVSFMQTIKSFTPATTGTLIMLPSLFVQSSTCYLDVV